MRVVEQANRFTRAGSALVLASLVSIGFYMAGAVMNNNWGYWFMVWNLFLAWLPLLFVLWLIRSLRTKRWSSWQGIVLSIMWLGFLPNSFYIVSDYIHLQDVPSVDILYDAVMLTAFVITGLALGYLSLYLFHLELKKRLPARTAAHLVGLVLFLCAVAIYLGRDLRWNTWDLFINPAGILFDVSDRLINLRAHPHVAVTIISFFVLLGMTYLLIWSFAPASGSIKRGKRPELDK